MILFERGKQPGAIYINPLENSAVQIAARNLAADIEKVCGVRPVLANELTGDVILAVGTVEYLPDVPGLRTSALRGEDGTCLWEAYLQQAVGGRLWLAGADRRGAVYAIYDFCERIGVSAWYDMADVPVRKKERIDWPEEEFHVDWPGVKYRGIFLNDEEELDAWARKHTHDGTIGPETYAKIFELILRLKGNLIWPAMHVNAFNMDPENGRLAEEMGIVTGTSHCDMLHRSNQNEWKPWVRSRGCEGLQYDYTIPGQNRERLLEYWRGSLEQNRDYEACYTVGMRGIHDSGFVTSGLDTAASPEEQMAQKQALLEEIIRVQRELVREVHPGEEVPQSFVPYKEVLPIYDSGLKVPEDVTLIWVDDNHGYVRRYPDAREQKRSGGNGLYYHSSYWAPPGMSWLFVCSTPLAHMGNELKKCYEQNIRRLWVDNVGALKPIEQDMEYFLRCGWEAGRPDSVMLDARRFTREWIDRNFSGSHGAEAAEIYTEFARLGNLCKPEHMRSGVFSQTAYGDEAGDRLWRMYELSQAGEAIWRSLPEEERDAFFQLFLMKMKASFFIAASYYYADRSREAFALGAMRAADENTRKSREMDDLKRLLVWEYNKKMSEGRWDGILTPEEFPPPPLEQYPACQPALSIGEAGLIVRLPDWGEADCLPFERSGEEKWFELFQAGKGALEVYLSADPGILLSEEEISLESEARVAVQVTEDFRAGFVHVRAGGQTVDVAVRRQPESFVHIRAEEGRRQEGFSRIADLGRGTGSVLEAGAAVCEESPARLELLFRAPCTGPCECEVIRFLTLRPSGLIRLRLTLDSGWQTVVSSETTDEYLGDWEEAACRDGEKLSVLLPEVEQGPHTLLVEALDPYITLDSVNLYFGRKVPSMLGPGALCRRKDTDMGLRLPPAAGFRRQAVSAAAGGRPEKPLPPGDGIHQRTDIPSFDIERLSAMFRAARQEVLPPRVPVCGDAFWKQDMLYARNELLQPFGYGKARQDTAPDGGKDVVSGLYSGRITEREGRLAWEAENALCQSPYAWHTGWTHRQAETNGRTGLAMWLPPEEPDVERPGSGPELNYRFVCRTEAVWHLWLLMKYDDRRRFACRFFLDGKDLRDTALVCRDHFHTYRTVFSWCWQKLLSVQLSPGEHLLTIRAETTGLAIDRFYMTAGDEIPPLDDEWEETSCASLRES